MRSRFRRRCSIPRAARDAMGRGRFFALTAHPSRGCTVRESWVRSTAICIKALETLANAWRSAASLGAMPLLKRPGNSKRDAATGLKFAAAIGLVEPLGILFRQLFPGLAAAAQRAGEVGRALLVERLAPLLPVGR